MRLPIMNEYVFVVVDVSEQSVPLGHRSLIADFVNILYEIAAPAVADAEFPDDGQTDGVFRHPDPGRGALRKHDLGNQAGPFQDEPSARIPRICSYTSRHSRILR